MWRPSETTQETSFFFGAEARAVIEGRQPSLLWRYSKTAKSNARRRGSLRRLQETAKDTTHVFEADTPVVIEDRLFLLGRRSSKKAWLPPTTQ